MKTRWSESSKEILKESGGREPALLKVKICPKTMEMKVWVCLRKTKCSKIKTDLGIYEHLILKKRQHHRAERARWSFQEMMLKHPNWGKEKKKRPCFTYKHTQKLMLIVKHLSAVLTDYQPEAFTPNVHMLSKLTNRRRI